MRRLLLPLLLVVSLLVGLVWAGEYDRGPLVITKENQFKVIVGLGGPKAVLVEPGWDPTAWRIPLVDVVHVFDSRLQYLNARPVQMVIANNENLIVDYYAVWRITDPLDFLKGFPNGIPGAESRIQEIVNSLVGSKIGRLSLAQLLERVEVLDTLAGEASERLGSDGVEVVDVRLNRTELPSSAVPAAYAQMREQRRALSREHRAQGDRQAREIRAEAEKLAVTTLAGARANAQRTRGAGDAQSTRIYAKAYGKDPEFYSFVRTLQAYEKTVGEGTTLVVRPDHEFFRYLAMDPDPDPAGAGSRREAARPAPWQAPAD
ncbi:MAG: protease modulator HflC [Deltaproteobacteria bacterium]|nr:protease modulator HflC [Deltaproteobacteria bacterium]MBW2420543.1 protease modulator HflC [Deltaproteobacteria bacterium]